MGYPKSTLRPTRASQKAGLSKPFRGGGGSFPVGPDTRAPTAGDYAKAVIDRLASLISRDTRDDELADPANYFGGGGAGGSWTDSRPLAADPRRPVFNTPGGTDCGPEERDPQGWGHSSYYYVGCNNPRGDHVGYNASASINNSPPPVPWQGGSHGTPSGNCNNAYPAGGSFGTGGSLYADPAASVSANGAALVTAWGQEGSIYHVQGTHWLTDGFNGTEDTWDQCLPSSGSSGFLPRDPARPGKRDTRDGREAGDEPGWGRRSPVAKRLDGPRDVIMTVVVPPVGPMVMTVTTRPNSAKPAPRRRETRRKPSLRGHMGRLWVAIGKFTEVEDVVKALHAALPKECQERPWQKSGRRTQARDMIDNLLKCGSKIDPAKALENLINEQIEDYYYGNIIGKPGKWLNQKTGAYTGGTRLVGATVGEVLPSSPKVNLTDPDAGWLLIPGG